MKVKALMAAISLVAASSAANAAFDQGTMVLSVLNTADPSTSIAIDLGITAADFYNGSVASQDLLGGVQEAALVSFLNASSGSISWDILGTLGGALPNGVVTSSSSIGANIPGSTVDNSMSTNVSWVNSIQANANFGADDVHVFADATVSGGAADGNHAVFGIGQNAGLGDTMDVTALTNYVVTTYSDYLTGQSCEPGSSFSCVGTDESLSQTANLGTISLSADGTQLNYTSAVPVPAAVWLFGSAILGMAGVSRRRAA